VAAGCYQTPTLPLNNGSVRVRQGKDYQLARQPLEVSSLPGMSELTGDPLRQRSESFATTVPNYLPGKV